MFTWIPECLSVYPSRWWQIAYSYTISGGTCGALQLLTSRKHCLRGIPCDRPRRNSGLRFVYSRSALDAPRRDVLHFFTLIHAVDVWMKSRRVAGKTLKIAVSKKLAILTTIPIHRRQQYPYISTTAKFSTLSVPWVVFAKCAVKPSSDEQIHYRILVRESKGQIPVVGIVNTDEHHLY